VGQHLPVRMPLEQEMLLVSSACVLEPNVLPTNFGRFKLFPLLTVVYQGSSASFISSLQHNRIKTHITHTLQVHKLLNTFHIKHEQ
jgi:hypothetical protein